MRVLRSEPAHHYGQALVDWASALGPGKLAVLTGAGCSTESGIPDYRSPQGAYSQGYKPMTHGEFMGSEDIRKRYWGRGYLGYPLLRDAKPNSGHLALSALGRGEKSIIGGVITQNVDGLHMKAGSQPLIEVHGKLRQVRCMSCGAIEERNHYHDRFGEMNGWVTSLASFAKKKHDIGTHRPDGDTDADYNFSNVELPQCESCGDGILKPDVVLFGANVPHETKQSAKDLVRNSSGLLVIGTTVETWSALSLLQLASRHNLPIAVINDGPTRAESDREVTTINLKVEARIGEVLNSFATCHFRNL